jgi:MoxR-like ATPase
MTPPDDPVDLEGYVPGEPIIWTGTDGESRHTHVLSRLEILAVRSALAADRALLVRGEPGTGKTQLARAAAQALKRPFVSYSVDSRTEARDLLWRFDAVARLAEAQLIGARGASHEPNHGVGDDARGLNPLEIRRFIQPGPLWWALNWGEARAQAVKSSAPIIKPAPGCDPANGVVVLIDEIDKAESEVPNGLLEALGEGSFTPQGFAGPIDPAGSRSPLVIITTNEERALPDAFLRRCLVLHLKLPSSRDELIAHLITRGRAHFGKNVDELLNESAGMLADDRKMAQDNNWRPLPGQAEYLDLVRAVIELAGDDVAKQRVWLDRVAGFALRKHPDAVGDRGAAR